MSASDPFKSYTQKVCEQIRWKKAHPAVAKEMENHLLDQRDAYIAQGDEESAATEKALLQMGDPVSVGMALDSAHKPAPQWGMIGLVLVLFALGAVIQFYFLSHGLDETYSASSPARLTFFLVLGLAAFVGAYFLDFSFMGKHPFLLPVFLLLLEIFRQVFYSEAGGVKWICFGGFTISPASISLLFPLAFCGLFYHLRNKGRQGYFLGGVLAAFICILLAADFPAGGLLIFVASAGILMLIAARRSWFGERTTSIFLFFVVAAVVIFGVFLLTSAPYIRYRFSRLLFMLHPESDPTGAGYLPLVIRDTLENAVLFGQGTPMEIRLWLPDMRSDFVLTYITYQFGWLVSGGIVALLAVFFIFGFRKCLKQKSILGKMVSLSILTTLAAETLLYIAVNLGFMPAAPIALPFLPTAVQHSSSIWVWSASCSPPSAQGKSIWTRPSLPQRQASPNLLSPGMTAGSSFPSNGNERFRFGLVWVWDLLFPRKDCRIK